MKKKRELTNAILASIGFVVCVLTGFWFYAIYHFVMKYW